MNYLVIVRKIANKRIVINYYVIKVGTSTKDNFNKLQMISARYFLSCSYAQIFIAIIGVKNKVF